MGQLGPFQRVLRDARQLLAKDLADGDFHALNLAVLRRAIELMDDQLALRPDLVLEFTIREGTKYSPAQLWFKDRLDLARRLLDPSFRDPNEFRIKVDEYDNLSHELIAKVHESRRYIAGDRVINARENATTKKVMGDVAKALQTWARNHRYDSDFLDIPARLALRLMLSSERFDLMVALRLATDLPSDISVVPLQKAGQRPFYVSAIEAGISFIPFVGTAVTAYEAFAGFDLFGYPLSDVDRGIMAACVFLPFMGRTIREERALYSSQRMVRNFGGEAAQWDHALALGERIAADVNAIRRMSAAEAAVAARGRLEAKAASELADSLKAIDIAKAATGVPAVLSKRVTDAFDELVRLHPRFAELDANAIQRLASKKAASHIDGQLFEEILENRVMVWLNDPAGKAALGLGHFQGRLDFIPGHLIRDGAGLQLTDGMIVRRIPGKKMQIVAVFEVKAGSRAALGLAFKPIRKLTKDEKAVLADEVERAFKELQDSARRGGPPVTLSRADIQERFLLAESRGQIGSDIERLTGFMKSKTDESLTRVEILVAGERVAVQFSPRHTKFFGVVPRDVSTTVIAKELGEAGIKNFEVLSLGFTTAELKGARQTLAAKLGIKK